MQHDFPDLAEGVPEQDLLLSSWPGEIFDDYWGELEDMAVGTSDTLPGDTQVQTGASTAHHSSEPFSGVREVGFDSWSAEDLQPLNGGVDPPRPSGPVITTGALPVASEQPPTFLPPQEPNRWSDSFAAPTQQPQLHQQFPLNGIQQYVGMTSQLPYQPTNGFPIAQPEQADSQLEDSDALLKQVEEILKGDKSPSVQARLRALVAAQGKSDGPAVSQSMHQQPSAQFSQLVASQANPAVMSHAFNTSVSAGPATASFTTMLAGPQQSGSDTAYQRPLHRQSLKPPVSQLQASRPAPNARQDLGLQAAAGTAQLQMMSRGMDSFAWPSSNQLAVPNDVLHRSMQSQQQGQQQTSADPVLTQAFLSLSGRHPQLPQQLPQQLPVNSFQLPDSLLPQNMQRTSAPQSNAMQTRRAEEQTRQTGARSLQQQAQARLPRQDTAQANTGSYPSEPALIHSVPKGTSGMAPGLLDAWGLPVNVPSQGPDRQRARQGSSSGHDAGFAGLTSAFAAVTGTQSSKQSLLDPIRFDSLPTDPAAGTFDLPSAQYGSHPRQSAGPTEITAALPTTAGRLPVQQPAFSNAPAAPIAGSTGREPVVESLPMTFEPLPLWPAAPQRAPPPEDRAAAARNLALGANVRTVPLAVPANDIHPIFQGNSQDSSGATCGFTGASGVYTSQFSPVTSQAAASCPSTFGNHAQADIHHPPVQPAAQPELTQHQSEEQADDWAQFINMDAEADEDGQPQEQDQDDKDGVRHQQSGAEQAANDVADNNGGKPKRKRKRDSHQQELNKQAQHRYRERKKAKAADLAQQVQLLSSKAASLNTARMRQARLKEHNEALRKALEVKKAELSQAVAAARHASPQPEASPADDLLAEKVSVMEQKAEALAAQLHGKVFELGRHLKQSGLANKENVPWDGGIANSAGAPVLDIIRRLVHEIHVITHEAHKVEGADIWEVVHRGVPTRHCPPGCHCLHCKDKDAWLDVAESLKLTDEQKCKTMLSRDHTLHSLREVYQKRKALNLEAITLMVPQARGDMNGADGLKQHFAEINFFSRARNTGKMGEVVDKLKANLREEAHANAVLDYIMFTRILSPVQSAWFITEAYPLKFDCRALASAVFQLWGHMRLAPALLPQQPQQLQQQQPQQLPAKLLSAQQQQLASQMRAAACLEAPQAGPIPHMRAASPAQRMDPVQAPQASMDAAARQQGLMRSHPASTNLPSVPLQRQSVLPQHPQHAQQQQQQQHQQPVQDLPHLSAAQQQRRQQQQQQVQHLAHMAAAQHAQHTQQHASSGLGQVPVAQRGQYPQSYRHSSQLSAAQRAQQLQSLQSMAQASAGQMAPHQHSLTSSLQQQQQELERHRWQQLLQQRLGMPGAQHLLAGHELQGHLPARQNPAAAGPSSSMLEQQFMGLGALKASNTMMAGAVPRPSVLPVVVP